MSRIGKKPIFIPSNLAVQVEKGNVVTVKGEKGLLVKKISDYVVISIKNNIVTVSPFDKSRNSDMQSGTARSLIYNMILGVSHGFQKKLELVGVGYRAKYESGRINLTLGFSHPVSYTLPDGVQGETPSQTEITLKSMDKELLGKVAADIRSYRIPEAYKGKGVRYTNEKIITKEAKKK